MMVQARFGGKLTRQTLTAMVHISCISARDHLGYQRGPPRLRDQEQSWNNAFLQGESRVMMAACGTELLRLVTINRV